MPIKRLSQTSLLSFQKHSNLLAGNPAYSPPVYDLLQTTLITSNTRSVTFSGLDSYGDYKDLQIRMAVRSADTNALNLTLRVNGDTGSNYARHYMRGTGGAVQNGNSSSQTAINFGFTNVARADFPANVFAGNILDVLDFSNTSKTTTFRVFGGFQSSGQIGIASGLWTSTSAVMSIELYHGAFENWAAGSRFSLYGIKG